MLLFLILCKSAEKLFNLASLEVVKEQLFYSLFKGEAQRASVLPLDASSTDGKKDTNNLQVSLME